MCFLGMGDFVYEIEVLYVAHRGTYGIAAFDVGGHPLATKAQDPSLLQH